MPGTQNDTGLPILSSGLCLHSFFPGFVHFLAGTLAFGPSVAGSLAVDMLSLRDAFAGSRGNSVLRRTGPSVSESERARSQGIFLTKARKLNSFSA